MSPDGKGSSTAVKATEVSSSISPAPEPLSSSSKYTATSSSKPAASGETGGKLDPVHILLARVASVDLGRGICQPTDAQYWSKHETGTDLREKFDEYFVKTGKSNKNRIAEWDAFMRRKWEKLPRDTQIMWKKKNEEAHQNLVNFVLKQVLQTLAPEECAE